MRRLVDRVFTAPPTFPWPREERNGATFPIEPGDSRNGLASVCLTGSFFAVFPPHFVRPCTLSVQAASAKCTVSTTPR